METLLPALFHLLLAFAIAPAKLNNPMMSRGTADLRARHVQLEGEIMEVDLHKLKVNDPGEQVGISNWCVMSSFPTSGRPLNDRIARLSPAMR